MEVALSIEALEISHYWRAVVWMGKVENVRDKAETCGCVKSDKR
jgi:hypothetical protein